MKVAVDLSFLARETQPTGVGQYSLFLAQALERTAVPGDSTCHYLSDRTGSGLADATVFPQGQLPRGFRGRSVLVIHDVAIFRNPTWFAQSTLRRWYTTSRVRESVRRATALVAVSPWTAHEASEVFGVPLERWAVIPEAPTTACAHDAMLPRDDRGDFFLVLGTREPRKNIELAICGFVRWKQVDPQAAHARLLLAGKWGWKTDAVRQELARASIAVPGAIEVQEYVSEIQRCDLLSRARGLVYPSWYEGFGLPMVEAFAHGTPVIAARTSCLPEVAGDAALFVEPTDVQGMANVMQTLWSDVGLWDAYSGKAKTRSARFSWEEIGSTFWEVIRSASGAKG